MEGQRAQDALDAALAASHSCDHCGYRVAYKSQLIRHMRKHTGEKHGEKDYMCGDCGYRVAYKSHLIRHMGTHTGDKPFKCDQCDYSAKGSLDNHMRKHPGQMEGQSAQDALDKSHSCDQCGYRVAYKSLLIRHMRTHAAEKPFKCDQCDYSTAQKASLVCHMRKHTAE
ncbi:gastrula zinc finger protein XlCGF57.1-like [Branchiostoma floridae]|uniref:Gastrula zinc finger protein XlCGF57.1-like n=1 Tax=Branchiostoma floridae TaxID=7739 RepID=A0A9J7LVA9_BRAFL|nr:gastrula zinc finger protein XlCGF57.1-like [Branchiostoma floridae]